MDIWVDPERGNAERLVEVLCEFGFGASDPTNEPYPFFVHPAASNSYSSPDGL
jgi:hypothetical protein